MLFRSVVVLKDRLGDGDHHRTAIHARDRVGCRGKVHVPRGGIRAKLHFDFARPGGEAALWVAAGTAGDNDSELSTLDLDLIEARSVAVGRAHEYRVVDQYGRTVVEHVGQTRTFELDASFDGAIVGISDKIDLRSHGAGPWLWLWLWLHQRISGGPARSDSQRENTPYCASRRRGFARRPIGWD